MTVTPTPTLLVPVQGTPPCLTDTTPDPVLALCEGPCGRWTPEVGQERSACGRWLCEDCTDVHTAHGSSYAACHEPICND